MFEFRWTSPAPDGKPIAALMSYASGATYPLTYQRMGLGSLSCTSLSAYLEQCCSRVRKSKDALSTNSAETIRNIVGKKAVVLRIPQDLDEASFSNITEGVFARTSAPTKTLVTQPATLYCLHYAGGSAAGFR